LRGYVYNHSSYSYSSTTTIYITNSYSTGDVSATGSVVGGIAGYVYRSSITDSHSTGDVSATGSVVGGIAGYVDESSITNSYSTGNVSATDANSYVGGIVGRAYSSSSSSTISITNSYSTGELVYCFRINNV
jgi:hypothetical protein